MVNDTEIDQQDRTIVKILSRINGLMLDTLTHHKTLLTRTYISTEIPSFDSKMYQILENPYFFIFLTMVGWLVPKCFAISLVDLNWDIVVRKISFSKEVS